MAVLRRSGAPAASQSEPRDASSGLALVVGHALGILGGLHAGPGLFTLLVIWLPILAYHTVTFFRPRKARAPSCPMGSRVHAYQPQLCRLAELSFGHGAGYGREHQVWGRNSAIIVHEVLGNGRVHHVVRLHNVHKMVRSA